MSKKKNKKKLTKKQKLFKAMNSLCDFANKVGYAFSIHAVNDKFDTAFYEFHCGSHTDRWRQAQLLGSVEMLNIIRHMSMTNDVDNVKELLTIQLNVVCDFVKEHGADLGDISVTDLQKFNETFFSENKDK